MEEPVKQRPYSSVVRRERAAATRASIVESASDLFSRKGYSETTVADIAAGAGVSVDTIYASVGRKPELVLAVVDAVLGQGRSSSVDDRPYVRDIRAAATAEEKLQIYAGALGALLPKISPIFEALRVAASTDAECAAALDRLKDRRRSHMAVFVEEVAATGRLRTDIGADEIADFVWATNAPEFYDLLAQRGWSPERFAAMLGRLWVAFLLDERTVVPDESPT